MWLILVGAVVALAMGSAIGASGDANLQEPERAAAPAELVTVTETVTAEAAVEPDGEVVTVFVTPTPETVEADPPAGDGYTAGRYSFTDVQVTEDFANDFAGRARVTNTGGSVEAVIWTMTIFQGGSVVGTLSGTARNFEEGSTITVAFTGLDGYQEWDRVEFQVDTEF